jgi:hypothetical protein
MSPYTALLPSFHRKKYLVALISSCSILSEFLPITLANIPFSSLEMHIAWFISTYIAMGILSLMILGILVLIFQPRTRVEEELDQKPCTVVGKLRYIAPGGEADCVREGFLKRVDGLVRVDEDERVVERWGGGRKRRRRSMGMGVGIGMGRGKTGNGGAGAV